MTKKSDSQVNHRSAVTGQYVKESYAEKHPRTTVRETGPKLPPPPTKNGK